MKIYFSKRNSYVFGDTFFQEWKIPQSFKKLFCFENNGFHWFSLENQLTFKKHFYKKKKNIYIYIYMCVCGSMVYLDNILETQATFENNVYFGKQLENLF